MFVQTQTQTLGLALSEALVSALSARPAAALLVTPTIHLFTAGPSQIVPSNVTGDFTEATFAGYAAQVLTLPLTGPINLPGVPGVGAFNAVNFVGGAVVSPGQVILGYWIDTGSAGQILAAEVFSTPIPIANPGDFISLDMIFGQLNPAQI
jgi:hypothetical protein